MFWMTSFILSSASMLLLNKLAAAAVPRCRFALLSVQGLACVLLNYLGAKVGLWQVKAFDKEMFLIFLPPSVLFFLMLLTSLIALPQVSVSDILVARSLGLCLVAAGDCFFFQQDKNLRQKSGIVIIILGAATYAAADFTFSLASHAWLVVNSLANVSTQLLEKRAICKSVSQTAEGLAIIQNLYVIAAAMPLALTTERPAELVEASAGVQAIVLLSAGIGFVINLSYVKVNLSCEVTSIAVASSSSRVMALLVGSLIFKDSMTRLQALGAMVSILGAGIYGGLTLELVSRIFAGKRVLKGLLTLGVLVMLSMASGQMPCLQNVSLMRDGTLPWCLDSLTEVVELQRRGLGQGKAWVEKTRALR
ncbi:unnamed protein product [Effrenium voratum]|uniref:Sugar phosphate transporter domain-containing protein n=1 Tax=Effrenium voratum TaxID=2562239 RepID=A0AA36IA06_9DINO|nr:unnamed protein product [Effrenium voratum]CAJ1382870.1 unnamed protein product [Effrenium voratum]